MVEEYYGWNNKETWYVNMWLNADPDSYHLLKMIVRLNQPTYIRAEELRDSILSQAHRELKPGSGLMSDLLQHALNQVSWNQLITDNEGI